MNNSTTHITLDLNKQDSMEYVTVRKGDTVRHLSVMLTESGTPYSIADGTTAVLAARKSNGTYIYEAGTITGNRIEVTIPATFTAEAGKLTTCIRLTGSSAALTSPPFTIYVDEPAAPSQP